MREDALPAPRLGESSRAILRELGVAEEAIDRMLAAGIITTTEDVA